MSPTESPLLLPVASRLVKPEWATRVVSPAYDSLRAAGRAELMARDPYVFLHVTRSHGEGDAEQTFDDVIERNAAALEWLLSEGVYTEVRSPALYVYRLRLGTHSQIAVVGDVHLSGVGDARIRPHERTQPQRALQLADHLARVAVNSSPVALTYKDDDQIDAMVERVIAEQPPLLDFVRSEDKLAQTIWEVPASMSEAIQARIDTQSLYIVDGHHRVAASVELWERTGRADRAAHVLGALFPASQLRVAAFHRRVADLNGLDAAGLCDEIAARDFSVRPLAEDEEPAPERPGVIGLYVDGVWYRLEAFRQHPAEFDATVLQKRILAPILAVDEASRAGRLEYLPDSAGLGDLVRLTDAHGGAGFALHPVHLNQLMAVVDRGETLPPKSTYFAPKVRSGLFLTPR